MKTWHCLNQDGPYMQAMTVQELIDCLSTFRGDLPVVFTYEGVESGATHSSFEVRQVGIRDDEKCDALVVDVEWTNNIPEGEN